MSRSTIHNDSSSAAEEVADAREVAIDPVTALRVTALLNALAEGDETTALAFVDEFIADVGIDVDQFEASVSSYEREHGLEGAARFITFAPDGTRVAAVDLS